VFALRSAPCGDDADDTWRLFCGHHGEKSAARTVANGQEALLDIRVVEIET